MRLEDAQLKIQHVDPDLSMRMAYFFENADVHDRWSLRVVTKAFSFGECVMQNGEPLWPRGEYVDGDFLDSSGLTLGIVIDDSSSRRGRVHQSVDHICSSKKYLKPGDVIGAQKFVQVCSCISQNRNRLTKHRDFVSWNNSERQDAFSDGSDILYFNNQWLNVIESELQKSHHESSFILPFIERVADLVAIQPSYYH